MVPHLPSRSNMAKIIFDRLLQKNVLHAHDLDDLAKVDVTSPANEDVLQYDSATATWKNGGIKMPHLEQSDTTDQAIANVSNAQVITFNTDSHHQDITRTSSSRFTITRAGSYLITFSGIAKGATGKLIEVWLRLNGNDVANSNTIYTFKGSALLTVIAVNFLHHFAANDYFEFWTWGDDTSSTWEATAAGTTPTRPACPSIIITCNFVSGD